MHKWLSKFLQRNYDIFTFSKILCPMQDPDATIFAFMFPSDIILTLLCLLTLFQAITILDRTVMIPEKVARNTNNFRNYLHTVPLIAAFLM